MRRAALPMVVIVSLVLLFAGVAFAWPDYINGHPSNYQPGNSYGNFIWHSGHWHLRTSTHKDLHVFEGTVSS